MKLGDWNAVQQWSQKIHEMKQRLQHVDGLNANVDMNYVRYVHLYSLSLHRTMVASQPSFIHIIV